MFKILLTAYISLVAASGPLLCCCTLQHLTTAAGGKGCCAKTAAFIEHEHHAGHEHHSHQPGHHHHGTVKPRTNDEGQPSHAASPQLCDEERCGCDQDEKHLATLPQSHSSEQRGDSNAHWSFVPVISASLLLRFTAAQERLISDTAPILLYGREMLRAYQILLI